MTLIITRNITIITFMSKIQMVDFKALIQEASQVGSALLDHEDSRRGELDAQTRKSYNRAADLYAKLLHPVRNENNYKLLFDCWASFSVIECVHVLEEQTGLVVRLLEPTVNPRTLEQMYWDFCQYVRLFGIESWSENKFITECLARLKVVNTFQYYVRELMPVSESQFKEKTGIDPTKMCEYMTGNSNALINKLWSYHFTGLINRVLNPGCKLDSMLILISKQKGWNKTRFLENLAEPYGTIQTNYANPYTVDLSNAEMFKIMKGKAVINFDEVDASLRGKCASKTKAFITSTVDHYRESYARGAKAQPRACAIFGTSNNLEIIQDLGGDRRFYPVLLTKAIEMEWFKENYHLFMGYYKWLLNSGFKTYPSEEEKLALIKDIQPDFKVEPLYYETLTEFLKYIEPKNLAFSTTDLLMAVASILENKPQYEKQNVELLLEESGWVNNKAKLSTGLQPPKPKWSKGREAWALSRVDLKRLFEGWSGS